MPQLTSLLCERLCLLLRKYSPGEFFLKRTFEMVISVERSLETDGIPRCTGSLA